MGRLGSSPRLPGAGSDPFSNKASRASKRIDFIAPWSKLIPVGPAEYLQAERWFD
jgi:hypothetical protein